MAIMYTILPFKAGTSLAVQWLRVYASSAESTSSIGGLRSCNLCGMAKEKRKEKNYLKTKKNNNKAGKSQEVQWLGFHASTA